MYWYQMPNGDTNFGDELGPYILKNYPYVRLSFLNQLEKIYIDIFLNVK